MVLGTQFTRGVVLGTAMMHFLSDPNETFEDLTLQKHTSAFMLACAGYLLTMVADCVVSSVFRSDEKAGDLELQGISQFNLLFFFFFLFLFSFFFLIWDLSIISINVDEWDVSPKG